MASYVKKYRPKSLEEIYGQDIAVSQIRGMLKDKNVNQVIGIFGESGYGKTSLARIIACLVNNIPYTSSHPDILECNLGSDRGIENIRNITSMAQYKPSLKYRVIIADEIQSLTGPALQAALKPLEDVPEQTMWILCTNKPRSLPDTIMRRAIKIFLKQPTPEEIIPLLKNVVKKEKLDIPNSKELLAKIVDKVHGQPASALLLLESIKNLVVGKKKASYKECCNVINDNVDLGNIEDAAVKVIAALYKNKPAAAVKFVQLIAGEPVSAINLLLNLNSFIINDYTGFRGYYSPMVQNLKNTLGNNPPPLKIVVKVAAELVKLREALLLPGITDHHSLVGKIGNLAYSLTED